MKQLIFSIVATIAIILSLSSCTTVDSGYKGVEVSWGGETNMNQIYSEGMHSGFHWFFDDMIEYDVRERTTTHKFEFNDNNNMLTEVEVALDYSLDPDKVNYLHKEINNLDTKIVKTLKSACKEVVPQYSAVQLNIFKRAEAEAKLSEILQEELPQFYVQFVRLQMTDVELPKVVAQVAEQTAKQLEMNKLAEKKEAEKIALAKAQVAEAKGNFEAAEYDAKTKAIMSRPEMLALKRLEIQEMWAKKGVSPYGNNNVFGGDGVSILKGLN